MQRLIALEQHLQGEVYFCFGVLQVHLQHIEDGVVDVQCREDLIDCVLLASQLADVLQELVELGGYRGHLLVVQRQLTLVFGVHHHLLVLQSLQQTHLDLLRLLLIHFVELPHTLNHASQEGIAHLLQQVVLQLIQSLLAIEGEDILGESLSLLVHLLKDLHKVPQEGKVVLFLGFALLHLHILFVLVVDLLEHLLLQLQ